MSKQPLSQKMVYVGRIGAAVGIKGQMRFIASIEDISYITTHALYHGKELAQSCHVRIVGTQKDIPLVMIDGVTDRTQAELWRHTALYIPRDALSAALPEDEYYISDLIGMAIRNSENAVIGAVKAVYNFGAGDIIEIIFIDGKEEMVIFSDDNFPQIDMERGCIIYIPPNILRTT